jgi:hypothetical protein
MISWQELDIRAAPKPGTDLIGHSFLGIVEAPRGAHVPTVDYVANQIQVLSLMVTKKIEERQGLTPGSTQVKIRHPNGPI